MPFPIVAILIVRILIVPLPIVPVLTLPIPTVPFRTVRILIVPIPTVPFLIVRIPTVPLPIVRIPTVRILIVPILIVGFTILSGRAAIGRRAGSGSPCINLCAAELRSAGRTNASVPTWVLLVSRNYLLQERFVCDRNAVGDGDGFSGFVIDPGSRGFGQEIGNVLDERSGAKDVEALQSVTDTEDGLAGGVGIFEQKIVGGFATQVGGGGMRGAWGTEAGRFEVGVAAGKENAIAGAGEPHDFRGGQIERDADGCASRLFDRSFVLRQGALAVGEIGGVRQRDGDARGQL